MKTIFILLSALISIHSLAARDLLNIYVAPPQEILDWSSPGALYSSLFKSRFFLTKRPFGAAGADLVCQDKNYSLSVDPESFDVVAPVVFQGKGLGYLYSAHPGKILTEDLAVAKNKEVINSQGARFITFIISADQCLRIRTFWDEFKKHNIAKNFGLPHRPLMGEGATDTSVIVSSLEVAGLLVPDQREKWDRFLYLPKKLSGQPLSDEYISVFSLFSGSWGTLSDDSFVLHFWDPELIAKWIDLQIATKRALRKLSDGNKGIPGLEFDLTRLPVPQGTFWEQANDPRYGKKN
jgi:hypothetical protein